MVSLAYDLDLDSVEYFGLPEKREPLNIKVPASLKRQLKGLERLWKAIAKAKGNDPDEIDFTFTCERLLRVGLDGAWGQVGEMAGLSGMPKDEDEWSRLEKALQKNFEDERASRLERPSRTKPRK